MLFLVNVRFISFDFHVWSGIRTTYVVLEVILRTKKKIPPPPPPPLVPTPPPINGSCLEYSETKRNMIFVFVHCRGKNNPLGTDQIFPSSSVKVVKLDQMLHSRLSSFGS